MWWEAVLSRFDLIFFDLIFIVDTSCFILNCILWKPAMDFALIWSVLEVPSEWCGRNYQEERRVWIRLWSSVQCLTIPANIWGWGKERYEHFSFSLSLFSLHSLLSPPLYLVILLIPSFSVSSLRFSSASPNHCHTWIGESVLNGKVMWRKKIHIDRGGLEDRVRVKETSIEKEEQNWKVM